LEGSLTDSGVEIYEQARASGAGLEAPGWAVIEPNDSEA
jgi:hypothetical protein